MSLLSIILDVLLPVPIVCGIVYTLDPKRNVPSNPITDTLFSRCPVAYRYRGYGPLIRDRRALHDILLIRGGSVAELKIL